MSTYQYAYDGGSSAYKYSLADHQVYGVGRIGTYKVDEILVTSPTLATNDPAKQFFEITDHLGSVRAVVTGVKTGGYNADIVQMTDYHEFGQTMQGRSFVSEAYRYGYQGSEKDGEINSGAYTTEFRMLDARLGRWFMPDPITHPSQSPYCSMDNDPINFTDFKGLSSGPPPEGEDGTSYLGEDGGCWGGGPSMYSGGGTGEGGEITNGGIGGTNALDEVNGGGQTSGDGFLSGDPTFGGANMAGQAFITFNYTINPEFQHAYVKDRAPQRIPTKMQTFAPINPGLIPTDADLNLQGTMWASEPNSMQQLRSAIENAPQGEVKYGGSIVYDIIDGFKMMFSGLIHGPHQATNLCGEVVTKGEYQSAFIFTIIMFVPGAGEVSATEKALPTIDATGKVHGILPKVEEFGKYSKEELEILLEDLKKSVQKRIKTTEKLGRDRAHGQRQGAEQDLIKSLEKYLNR